MSSTSSLDERDRNKSTLELDRRILDDNVAAAINAAERIQFLARKELQKQGLAPAASSGVRGPSDWTDAEIQAFAKPIVAFVRQCVSDAVSSWRPPGA